MDISITSSSQSAISTFLNSTLFGVIVGGVIASLTSYILDKNKEQYEYRKDLAEAVRKAYSDFLSITFKGADEETNMQTYLRSLRNAAGPVFLFGSKDVVKNIETVVGGATAIIGQSGIPDEEKLTRISSLMQDNVDQLFESMHKDIHEGSYYRKEKRWRQFWK